MKRGQFVISKKVVVIVALVLVISVSAVVIKIRHPGLFKSEQAPVEEPAKEPIIISQEPPARTVSERPASLSRPPAAAADTETLALRASMPADEVLEDEGDLEDEGYISPYDSLLTDVEQYDTGSDFIPLEDNPFADVTTAPEVTDEDYDFADDSTEVAVDDDEGLVDEYAGEPSEGIIPPPPNDLTEPTDDTTTYPVEEPADEPATANQFSSEEQSYFLQPGEQTQPGTESGNIAAFIPDAATKRGTVQNILSWVSSNLNPANCPSPGPEKRSRTAEEIISSRCSTGCIDSALAFITLARLKGIPAVYVEGVSEDWLILIQTQGWSTPMQGHIFADVYLSDENTLAYVNPARGEYTSLDYDEAYLRAPEQLRYIALGKGRDSWDIGLRNSEDFGQAVREVYYIS